MEFTWWEVWEGGDEEGCKEQLICQLSLESVVLAFCPFVHSVNTCWALSKELAGQCQAHGEQSIPGTAHSIHRDDEASESRAHLEAASSFSQRVLRVWGEDRERRGQRPGRGQPVTVAFCGLLESLHSALQD